VSKANDKSEREKRKAVRRWSDRVLGARAELEGIQLDAEGEAIVRTVHWLAIVLTGEILLEQPRSAHIAALLKRVDKALDPPTGQGEQIATAARLIRMHAERLGATYLEGATHERAAVFLVAALEMNVHSAFGSLDAKAVAALLSRYTNTKDRQNSKLTAAGILLELNKLVKWPLGRRLSLSGIGNAIRRNL
jgi:hypothetical protein